MWYADETGFYFQAQTVKAMCKQLLKNPKVEVYFNAKDFSKVMRVYGKVRFIEDLDVRARCIKERPFVKNFGITEPDNPLLAVFHLYTGEAYFWTMADSMKEAQDTQESNFRVIRESNNGGENWWLSGAGPACGS